MVKKKAAKKRVKAVRMIDAKVVSEDVLPAKSVVESEDRQLFWFFVVVGVVFALFLVPYFLNEGAKDFDYGGIDWRIEEYAEPTGTIYHGQFLALNNDKLTFNIFLRNDPRTNDVYTEGNFSDFKFDGVVSWSDEIEACRGEVSRAMVDLGSFIMTGIGTGKIEAATTNSNVSNSSARKYVDCSSNLDKTVVVMQKGDSSVVQDSENPYCYVISVADCNDVAPIEKFITQTVSDVSSIEEYVKPVISEISVVD